jgi:NACalpha-BTF3-like transcription factor
VFCILFVLEKIMGQLILVLLSEVVELSKEFMDLLEKIMQTKTFYMILIAVMVAAIICILIPWKKVLLVMKLRHREISTERLIRRIHKGKSLTLTKYRVIGSVNEDDIELIVKKTKVLRDNISMYKVDKTTIIELKNPVSVPLFIQNCEEKIFGLIFTRDDEFNEIDFEKRILTTRSIIDKHLEKLASLLRIRVICQN